MAPLGTATRQGRAESVARGVVDADHRRERHGIDGAGHLAGLSGGTGIEAIEDGEAVGEEAVSVVDHRDLESGAVRHERVGELEARRPHPGWRDLDDAVGPTESHEVELDPHRVGADPVAVEDDLATARSVGVDVQHRVIGTS